MSKIFDMLISIYTIIFIVLVGLFLLCLLFYDTFGMEKKFEILVSLLENNKVICTMSNILMLICFVSFVITLAEWLMNRLFDIMYFIAEHHF